MRIGVVGSFQSWGTHLGQALAALSMCVACTSPVATIAKVPSDILDKDLPGLVDAEVDGGTPQDVSKPDTANEDVLQPDSVAPDADVLATDVDQGDIEPADALPTDATTLVDAVDGDATSLPDASTEDTDASGDTSSPDGGPSPLPWYAKLAAATAGGSGQSAGYKMAFVLAPGTVAPVQTKSASYKLQGGVFAAPGGAP